MNQKKSSLSCVVLLGLLLILGFVAFIASSSLMARAEDAFGPPSPGLSAFQRFRLGIELGWRADALLRPVAETATPVRFDIGLDEPTSQIVDRLQAAGLIREASLFVGYLVYTGFDTQLQAGHYELNAAMNAIQLTESLLDPTPETVTLVILAGWRLEEIAATLPSAGVAFTPEDFLLASWNPPDTIDFPDGFPAGATLEGYLLPGTYELDRDMDAVQALNVILQLGFNQNMGSELRSDFEQHGLSLHEALTLASIVEREAILEDEMPMIASVFHNRLAVGMNLETDPTVQYALGYVVDSWWKTPLTRTDLQVNSPYNTYLYAGLPPGPIAAPDLQALLAVAFPETSPYYFFQAACDGSGVHKFSETFEQHIANNCP